MWKHGIGTVDAKEHAAYLADGRRIAERKRIAEVLAANPQIGVLNGGKYYVYKDGEYVESSDPAKLI